MKFKTLLLGLAIFITQSMNSIAQGDSTQVFSLVEAQQYAIEHYFESVNAKLDIRAAEKKIWETTAIGLPQLSGEATYQHIVGDIPAFDYSELLEYMGVTGVDASSPISVRNSVNYGATLSQLIFSGEYIVGLQASKTYKTLSQENYDKAVIEVKENIASTYYGILVLEDNLKNVEKTRENLELTLEHTKGYLKVGLVEDIDADQLNLTLNNTVNSLNTLERQVSTMYALLNFQMGLPSGAKVGLKEDLEELIAQNIIQPETFQFDLNSHIDYQRLETQSKLMKLDMNRYKSQYLPTLSGFYKYSDVNNKSDIDFTIKHIVGLSLSVPIFSSGQRMAKVSQAKIEYEKALNMQEQQGEMIKIAALQAKFDYDKALEKYETEKLNVALSEKILKNTTEKYKQGMVSSIDLSQVNNQYLQAQMSYSAAVQELLTAKLSFDKAYSKL